MRRVLLLIVACVLTVAGCSSSAKQAASATGSDLNDNVGSSTAYQGFGLTPPQPRPSFVLTDTTGASYSFGQETAGRPTFLYFGYTHCPDVCPTTMADIGQALLSVPTALRAKTLVVFVTTDVANDTGPVIADWLKGFAIPGYAGFVGLYGTQAQVDAAQAAAHVMLATEEGKQHSAEVLLYGADDYARVSYVQSNNETALMTHDLPLVAKQ